MIVTIRYEHAEDDECGHQYRPGQMHAPERNYCKLIVNHPSNRHSTRRWLGDDAGFEWFDADESDLVWPERPALDEDGAAE